jgi:uncharacterized membrane protein YcaP (DUF421 family)
VRGGATLFAVRGRGYAGGMEQPDWGALFIPDAPVLETLVRGTVVYLVLFLVLRLVLRRHGAGIGLTDVLMVVLIVAASQGALLGGSSGITDGVLLIGVVAAWAWVVDWAGFRFPLVERLVHPGPLELVRDGRPNERNLRRELVTRDELMSKLREQGVTDIADVRRAYFEGDGELSVIPEEDRGEAGAAGRRDHPLTDP